MPQNRFIKLLFLIFLNTILINFQAHGLDSKKDNPKKSKKDKEAFLREHGISQALRASSQLASVSLTKASDTTTALGCSAKNAPSIPVFENRFDKVKQELYSNCEKLHLKILSGSCDKIVEDVMEVASPSCKSGTAAQAASSCSMGLGYLLEQFQGSKRLKYAETILKLDRLMNEITTGKRKLKSTSLFDLVLEASGGNKEIAINIISSEQMGGAGLATFNSQLSVFPSLAKDVLNRWQNEGGIFKNLKVKLKNNNLRTVPLEDVASVSQSKEYHYWARAVLSSGLKNKGYSSFVSRSIATSSAFIYEFYFDWQEHKSNGASFRGNLEGAIKDVLLSDEGSEFGSTD